MPQFLVPNSAGCAEGTDIRENWSDSARQASAAARREMDGSRSQALSKRLANPAYKAMDRFTQRMNSSYPSNTTSRMLKSNVVSMASRRRLKMQAAYKATFR